MSSSLGLTWGLGRGPLPRAALSNVEFSIARFAEFKDNHWQGNRQEQDYHHEQQLASVAIVMLQPRISPISASRDQALTSLATTLNSLALCSRHAPRASKFPGQLTFTRHASHAAQGRANGPKDSAGRRLGAKKTSTEYVIPGNIIFKQRGRSTSSTITSLSSLEHISHDL